MLISSEPPEIPLSSLPEAEVCEARSIQMVLRSLRDYTRSFAAAIALRNFCALRLDSKHPLIADWASMAARDGATILLHFGEALEELRHLRRTPSLKRSVKIAECNSAWKSFTCAFPGFDGADKAATAHESRTNLSFQAAAFPKTETIKIRHAGRTLKYQLNEASLSALIEIKNIVYEAFPSSKVSS